LANLFEKDLEPVADAVTSFSIASGVGFVLANTSVGSAENGSSKAPPLFLPDLPRWYFANVVADAESSIPWEADLPRWHY
jgi:hypothetical protein